MNHLNLPEHVKSVGDGASVVIAGATLLKWLPAAAAFITIVWTGIRIWETRTVQRVMARWRNRR